MNRPLMTDEAFVRLVATLKHDFRDQGTRLPPVLLEDSYAAVKAELNRHDEPFALGPTLTFRAHHKVTSRVFQVSMAVTLIPGYDAPRVDMTLRLFREQVARHLRQGAGEMIADIVSGRE